MSCVAQGATTCSAGPITTTTGNLFIASVGYCCDAFTSVTDSKLNSYGSAVGDVTAIDSSHTRQEFIAGGIGGASHTFTLTGASSSFFGALSVTEVSGAAAVPLDQTASGFDSLSSHATPSTSTTTQANELLVGYGSTGQATTTYTTDTGAGWTEQTNITTDVNTEGLITGTRIVSSIGTYAYTYTTSAAREASQGISTWKESASSSRHRCIGCGTDKKVIGE